MPGKSPRRAKKSVIFWLPILLVAGYFFISLCQLQLDIYRQRQTLARLETQCMDQRASNNNVERYLSMHDDTELIEKIAREKLGFAYPDETVYIDASGS